MSHTDKTDPYWVKLAREKTRIEDHGRTCTGDNCDIETSIGPWAWNARPGTTSEQRTVMRTVRTVNLDWLISHPEYDRWMTWRLPSAAFTTREEEHTYRATIYDGPRCDYRFTDHAIGSRNDLWGGCSCCGPDEYGKSHSRAEDREVTNRLRDLYNAGYDLDDVDYVFDNNAKWGERW